MPPNRPRLTTGLIVSTDSDYMAIEQLNAEQIQRQRTSSCRKSAWRGSSSFECEGPLHRRGRTRLPDLLYRAASSKGTIGGRHRCGFAVEFQRRSSSDQQHRRGQGQSGRQATARSQPRCENHRAQGDRRFLQRHGPDQGLRRHHRRHGQFPDALLRERCVRVAEEAERLRQIFRFEGMVTVFARI